MLCQPHLPNHHAEDKINASQNSRTEVPLALVPESEMSEILPLEGGIRRTQPLPHCFVSVGREVHFPDHGVL